MNLLRFSVQMKNDHQNGFLRNFTAAFDVYAFCICVDVPAEFDLKRFQRGVNASIQLKKGIVLKEFEEIR